MFNSLYGAGKISCITIILICGLACKKKESDVPAPDMLQLAMIEVDNKQPAAIYYDIKINPVLKMAFNNAVDRQTVAANISLNESNVTSVPVNYSYEKNDSVIVIVPQLPLKYLTRYFLRTTTGLQSAKKGSLGTAINIEFITSIDSSDKFPLLTDNQLLDTVQRRTFRFFWEFGHPISGMARERNSSGDVVTTGGTGFGIMSIITAVNRNFITRTEGRDRILKITNFLLNNCTRYHGAFAHWVNGASGATIPFSSNDNGADLVETSYLINGLLTARQYFNGADGVETDLRTKINTIWNGVEWNWFRQNNQNVLYWHWSPTLNWVINLPVRGWNEALIVYILASSSLTDSIPKVVYDNGWAGNGAIRNNNTYYGYQLPLGPSNGGPLFFAHYSFLGVNPNGLVDAYGNYQTQTTNHTKINYEYCKANPRRYYGYSNLCWGLTASDIPTGYGANEPNNDRGVITPTAALSSIPYTPTESMNALKFFYYKLGDKLWGPYGFYDAFSLKDLWFANSTLAIDQGPIIVMIENYRSGLLWNLFSGAPEIKNGLRRLGFTAPYL
ncbi:MAG: Ig-like domain-containing protein [Chitinophagaceae bacterium]|nr:Ig-like domain-containing protein [Chitinophagaceae bacterium]